MLKIESEAVWETAPSEKQWRAFAKMGCYIWYVCDISMYIIYAGHIYVDIYPHWTHPGNPVVQAAGSPGSPGSQPWLPHVHSSSGPWPGASIAVSLFEPWIEGQGTRLGEVCGQFLGVLGLMAVAVAVPVQCSWFCMCRFCYLPLRIHMHFVILCSHVGKIYIYNICVCVLTIWMSNHCSILCVC